MAVSKPLAVGAAVLAVVPSVMSGAVSAVAVDVNSFPSWSQWRELYDYNVNSEVTTYIYDTAPWASYWKYYFSAVMAVVEGVYINSSYVITPGDFSGMSGFYLYNGVRRFGSLYASGVHENVSVPYEGDATAICAVWSLQDGSMELFLIPSDNDAIYNYTSSISDNIWSFTYRRTNQTRPHTTVYFKGSGICDDVSIWNNTLASAYFSVVVSSGDPVEWRGTSSDYIGVASTPYALLGQSSSFPSLPTSDAFPTITADNALDYVSDVLNPYFSELEPEMMPYLFDPYSPDSDDPVYPSEFVQGVPKSWTVENPRLPSYSLDLQLPTADFEAVDVSPVLEEHATGIGFWWQMLTYLLDSFGVKELFIFAMVMGLLVTVLTQLGR